MALDSDDFITRLSLAWSNVYLLQDGANVALIDTGLQKDRPRLLAELAARGIAPADVRAIYLTHGHCDHAGSAAFFARQGAAVYAHKREWPFLTFPRRTYVPRGSAFFTRPLTSLCFTLCETLYTVERGLQGKTLRDGDVLDAPGGALRVVPCPGHTPGHVAYFRPADGVLFSGDAILNIVPFKLDTALSLPIGFLSTDWPETIASAQRLSRLPVARLLAGHGVPFADAITEDTSARLRQWANALQK